MSLNFKGVAVTFLTATLRALGAGVSPASNASPAARIAALSPSHCGALGSLLSLLPVNDLIALAEGNGSVDDVLDVAERGADLVRVAFPPAAIAAEEVKLGLEALQFLLDLAGVGPDPFKITGGYPDIMAEETSPNFKNR